LSPYQYAIAQGVILILVMIVDAISWSRPKKQRRPRNGAPAPLRTRPQS
jgi:simple sugar transport system permease protein